MPFIITQMADEAVVRAAQELPEAPPAPLAYMSYNTDSFDTAIPIYNRPDAFRLYPSSGVADDGNLMDPNNVWTMLDFVIFLNNLPDCVILAPKDEP
jgi:hypothetical protein